MKNSMILLLGLVTFLMVGCSGTAPAGSVSLVAEASAEIIKGEPDWWSTPAPKEGYVLGKAEGVSRDKGGARMKAQNLIINDFRQKTKAIAEGRSELFFKESGIDENSEILQTFESIQNSIWNGSVSNWVEFQSKTLVEKSVDSNGRARNIFRHYILGGLDQAAADRKLLAAIKREKELLAAYEKTKSFEKLQAGLEKYKDQLK